LIVVLAMMVILGLIVASTVAVSQLDDRLTALDRDRAEAAYMAESAAARVLWLLRHDCATYPTRNLGNEEILQNKDEERFMADGATHTIAVPGGQAEVSIQDMINGTDISGPTPDKALARNAEEGEFAEDDARFERYQKFFNALRDYVDPDNMLQLVDGFEADEYAAVGRRPLPRNGPFQYREEILWIPGAREFFKANEAGVLDAFLVPPPTLRLPPVRGKPSFFSAGADQLTKEGGFTADEAAAIIATRERWRKEPGKLEDIFDPDTLSRLQQRFSFRESGFYTLVVKASVGPDAAPRILTCSLQLSGQLAGTETLRYYEWLFLQ
jgi:hypothetical protein